MFNYLSDAILLAVICSIPYLVSALRLRNSRSRKAMYDSAKDTTGMPKRLS
jgi:hypothetical protein